MEEDLEKDIKILEDYSYAITAISSATEKDILVSKSIEHIISAYKKLEEENKEYKKEAEKLTNARNWYFEHYTSQACTPEMLNKILRIDYVPKQTIKDKINWYKDYQGTVLFKKYNYEEIIEVLENLLKGE